MTRSARRAVAPFDGPEHRKARGPNGRRLCRWCGVEVPPRRQTWCSDTCVEMFLALSSLDAMRRWVLNRDGPCCAICREDVVAGQEVIHQLWWQSEFRYGQGRVSEQIKMRAILVEELVQAGFGKDGRRCLFEIDHRVPLIEGGKHEHANLRLLCLACHKAETKALARRRAEARKR